MEQAEIRSPHADKNDWVAYIDEIVVDNNPDKRFSTDKYALTYDKDAVRTRKDRSLNSVGLTSSGVNYTSAANTDKVYTDNTTVSVFSAKAGAQVQPLYFPTTVADEVNGVSTGNAPSAIAAPLESVARNCAVPAEG